MQLRPHVAFELLLRPFLELGVVGAECAFAGEEREEGREGFSG
jgi:hypothetical protein